MRQNQISWGVVLGLESDQDPFEEESDLNAELGENGQSDPIFEISTPGLVDEADRVRSVAKRLSGEEIKMLRRILAEVGSEADQNPQPDGDQLGVDGVGATKEQSTAVLLRVIEQLLASAKSNSKRSIGFQLDLMSAFLMDDLRPNREIANKWGVSPQTVNMELKRLAGLLEVSIPRSSERRTTASATSRRRELLLDRLTVAWLVWYGCSSERASREGEVQVFPKHVSEILEFARKYYPKCKCSKSSLASSHNTEATGPTRTIAECKKCRREEAQFFRSLPFLRPLPMPAQTSRVVEALSSDCTFCKEFSEAVNKQLEEIKFCVFDRLIPSELIDHQQFAIRGNATRAAEPSVEWTALIRAFRGDYRRLNHLTQLRVLDILRRLLNAYKDFVERNRSDDPPSLDQTQVIVSDDEEALLSLILETPLLDIRKAGEMELQRLSRRLAPKFDPSGSQDAIARNIAGIWAAKRLRSLLATKTAKKKE